MSRRLEAAARGVAGLALTAMAATLLSAGPGRATWPDAPGQYKYGDVASTQGTETQTGLDERVLHAPRNTFRIEEAENAGNGNPPVWVISRKDPTVRVKIAVPQPKGDDEQLLSASNWYVSPTERYLLSQQKVVRGVNAVTLYERTSDLHYRRVFPQFFSDIAAANAEGKKQIERLDSIYYLVTAGWHGSDDRYLDFQLDMEHGPIVWRGSYDTVTHRFIEDRPYVFGPKGPRAPGELFPETRTRRLTDADVAPLSYAKVRYAINEIYARHGYTFPDDDEAIPAHFGKFDWYRPDFSTNHMESLLPRLTPIELANLPVLVRRRDALSNTGAR